MRASLSKPPSHRPPHWPHLWPSLLARLLHDPHPSLIPSPHLQVLLRRADPSADKSPDTDALAKSIYQAVLGPGGANLASTREELRGELVGVVALTKDKRKLVADALAPANILRVKVKPGRARPRL